MKPLGVLTGGKSYISITQITKNVQFSSIFNEFLAPVAMATTKTTKYYTWMNFHGWKLWFGIPFGMIWHRSDEMTHFKA